MKVYITAPFRDWENKNEIEKTCSIVKKSGFEDYCFVRDEKIFNDEYEMMKRAKKEVGKCEVLLIDYDGPTHGRMIELGMTYAMNKKIVLITKRWTRIKDTVRGVSDSIIEYENIEDIIQPMAKLFSEWK